MSKEKIKQNANHVGGGFHPDPNSRGITLIALIITIIIMLILVGVTVTVALKGELFGTAKSAKAQTQEERDKEQNLAEGKVEIGETWYNSINEYVNGDTEEDENIQTGPLGEAINTENYGKKVIGYTSKGEGLDSLIWRVFYQDENNVYLISETSDGNAPITNLAFYNIGNEEDPTLIKKDILVNYNNGTDVSVQGRNLMPAASALFTDENENENIIATAYLCDIDVWEQYTDSEGKAAWAMGSPTTELLVKSYNTMVESDNQITISVDNEYGYSYSPSSLTVTTGQLDRIHSIFSKSDYLWLASPGHCTSPSELMRLIVKTTSNESFKGNIGGDMPTGEFSARPIVCIPVSSFDFTLE